MILNGRRGNRVIDHHGGKYQAFSLASVHRFFLENSID